MADVDKDLLEFRRQFGDERDERFRRAIAKLEGKSDNANGMEADLSGYIPDFRDGAWWALDSLPDHIWFASNADRVSLALDSMEGLSFFSEIPHEYLTWAKSTDWSNPEIWLREATDKIVLKKFANFISILLPFIQKHCADIPNTIEHIIANRSPSDGDIWYAARMVHALADLMRCHEAVQDEIVSGIISEKFDLEDKLEKATQSAFTIGWLYRDHWWLNRHGEAATRYYERTASLAKAQLKGSSRTKERYAKLKEDCLRYYERAFREKGYAFIGAPISVIAETICEIAIEDRPNDFIAPNGQPLSLKWFQETLEDFQAEGRHAQALERVLTKGD